MSERGKRVFRFLLDPERDADVITRMEARPSMTGYVRELVRRDMHDERLDFAALKLSEMQAENAKLREQLQDAEHEESVAWDRVRSTERRNDELRKLLADFRDAMWSGGEWTEPFDKRMRELGVEV